MKLNFNVCPRRTATWPGCLPEVGRSEELDINMAGLSANGHAKREFPAKWAMHNKYTPLSVTAEMRSLP